MEDERKMMSVTFDPEDPQHLEMIKNMACYNNAKLAVWEFRNKLRRAINKEEFPDHCINQIDETYRPTNDEVCKSAEAFWNLLSECFEQYDAEEFLKE